MDVLLSIGQFSKMTYLSVKALRYYHDVGLLEPALVDPDTGYRHYAVGQVGTAQAIRRFRDLEMPIDEVRKLLQAPDEAGRNRAILVHLERMHHQLDQTRAAVESLQTLLSAGPGRDALAAAVEIRRLAATRALVSREEVAFDDCGDWLTPALAALRAEAEVAGLAVAGVDGALYSDAFFEAGVGEVTAFVPVVGDVAEAVDLPATTAAVLVHDGPFADLDRAYGALGTAVAEMGVAGPGPIREHYLSATSTEVCWPVVAAAG